MKFRYIVLFFLIMFIVQLSASITILAPDNPSSLPLIMASLEHEDFDVKIFRNHTQAHSQFLSGNTEILLTGYAVGESFAKRGVPVKLGASWVKSMNYLVTDIEGINSFSQLKGEKIYFPFQGSPIERMSLWLAEKEGLDPQEDIEIGYLPFGSMIKMMKNKSIHTAVMPVSTALQITGENGFYYAVNLDDKWADITGSNFYPQLGLFYNPDKVTIDDIQPLFSLIEEAIRNIKDNKQEVLDTYSEYFTITRDITEKSLDKLEFELCTGNELEYKMELYFEKSGIEAPPRSFYSVDK